VGDSGLLPLLHAKGPLPFLRNRYGESPLGGREASVVYDVHVVFGQMGQAAQLGGSCSSVSNPLGACVPFCPMGRPVGVGRAKLGGHHGDRGGRRARQRGHKYLILVYQLDEGYKRLLWIGRERTEQTFRGFFDMLGEVRSAAIRFVCSDMWKPYLDVVAEKAKQALNVLDRFHIVAAMNKAIEEVRAQEARALVKEGYEPVLKHSHWCLLKRPENLTDKQDVKLADLLRYNLSRSGLTCSKRISSSSGTTSRPIGLDAFWTAGARRRCGPASSP
jgi:hypothetical protein